MGTAVGLQTVFGTAEETTYGTPVTPDRWFEIVSESLARRQEVIQSSGIRATGRNARRGNHRSLVQRWGEGDIELEVATKGMGRWFKHMLGGTPVTTQPDSVGAPSVYMHTFEMGSLQGKSLTIQKGIRDQAGAEVESFTFHGSKITTWEFAIAVGDILTLSLGVDTEDVDTSTPLAAHSYIEANLFHFAQGAVKLNGSNVAKVLGASVAGDNALKTDSFFLGTGGLKGEPAPNDFPTVDGSVEMEFDNPATVYNLFAADTAAALVLEFTGANIAGAFNQLLRITIPEIHFTGDTPQVGGPDVVSIDAPFEAAYDGTNASVKIEYQTTDTAV